MTTPTTPATQAATGDANGQSAAGDNAAGAVIGNGNTANGNGNGAAAAQEQTAPAQSQTRPQPQQQPQTAMAAQPRRSLVEWTIEPHLIGNRLLAMGRARDGARVNDPLAGEGIAFSVFRDKDRYDDGSQDEVVLYVVPRPKDGMRWPVENELGVPIVTAHEYDVSDGRFLIYADTVDPLPDERRHTLRVWGLMADGGRRLLAEQEIGRYVHVKLPRISLWSILRRWLLMLWRRIRGMMRSLMWLGVGLVALALLGLTVIGAIVVIDPSWMGLEYVEEAKGIFQWLLRLLPWR